MSLKIEYTTHVRVNALNVKSLQCTTTGSALKALPGGILDDNLDVNKLYKVTIQEFTNNKT